MREQLYTGSTRHGRAGAAGTLGGGDMEAVRRPLLSTAVVVTAMLCGVGTTQADWLVLRSGDQVETRGEWKVEGPKVVFTSTRGVLSSVRASEVDVDASRALTAKKHEEANRVA